MPVLHLVQIMPSYSRKTINRMHTKINTGSYRQLLAALWRYAFYAEIQTPRCSTPLGVTGNFNWRNTGKQTACSNLSCTLVMEEGRQISKRLSYMAEFKREVIRCTEDKGNSKTAGIFGVDESNVRLWRKHKATIGCEASRKKFTGSKKGRFL